ncbi:MAG: lamin tail domain-containing protein [Candidatus Thermoplasmatota archaeon]|nr:lamin tail domain-containing protein [Candidatus Thermoplasmatota archaeon]
MASNHKIWTLLMLVLLTTPFAPASAQDATSPVMVEVQPNPEGPDRGNEWVEFANPLPVDLDLEGFYLTDYDRCSVAGQGWVDPYYWPLSGIVPAQGRLVVELPSNCPLLRNGGEVLALTLADGTVLQEIAWGDEGPLDAPDPGESLFACHQEANLHGAWQPGPATRAAGNPAC